jgi:hypothetical protein
MRVSIQVADDICVVDRVAKRVDCTPLRNNKISAVQWYDDHGEIEFERHHKPNEVFHSFEEFQSLVTAATPIGNPKPPTPQELDETHNRFLLEHPDWRKPWDQRDAEIRARLDADNAERIRVMMQHANSNQPQPPMRPPMPTPNPQPANVPPNTPRPPEPPPPAPTPTPQNPMSTPPKSAKPKGKKK